MLVGLADDLELYPDYRPALQLLALSYWMAGEREKALEAAARSEPANGDRWQRFDAVPGFVYSMAGDTERARKILIEWTERARSEWVPKTSLALVHLALGEEEEARGWLREARLEQDPWLVLVASDPAFRPLSYRSAGDFFKTSVRAFPEQRF